MILVDGSLNSFFPKGDDHAAILRSLFSLLRFIFCLTMALIWSGLDRRAIAQVSGNQPLQDAEHTADSCRSQFSTHRRGRSSDPARLVDVVPIIKALNADPGAMFQWVRDHTFWIPYHGVLRGPTGVLMDRQGNSIDRASSARPTVSRHGQNRPPGPRGLMPPEMAKDLLTKLSPVPLNPLMTDPGAATPKLCARKYRFPRSHMPEMRCRSSPGPNGSSRARLQLQRLQEGTFERVTDQAPAVAALTANSAAAPSVDRARKPSAITGGCNG